MCMEAAQVGGLGGTYGGNALACAAALAVLDAMEAERLPERAAADRRPDPGPLLRVGRRAGPASATSAASARWSAMELVSDPAARTPDKALTGRLLGAALERGVVLLSAGTYGNVVGCSRRLTAEEAIIDEGLAVMEQALAAAVGGAMEPRGAGAAAGAG